MYRKLINIEPDGDRKEFVLYTVKKGKDNVVALFLDPPSEKGRSSLRQGDNMWLYIPNVGKPVRITSLQSVVGGVFNNSDFLRLDYSAEYDAESVVEEDEAYLLELKAKNRSVAYDRLKMWVDQETRAADDDRGLRRQRLADQDPALQQDQGLRQRHRTPRDVGDRQPTAQGVQVRAALRRDQGTRVQRRGLYPELHVPSRRTAAMSRWWCLLLCLSLGQAAWAQTEEFSFDVSSYEKKPYEWSGYLEFDGGHLELDEDSAFYNLSFPGDDGTGFVPALPGRRGARRPLPLREVLIALPRACGDSGRLLRYRGRRQHP